MHNESNKHDLSQWLLAAGITDAVDQTLCRQVTAEEARTLGFGQPTDGVVVEYHNLDGTAMMEARGRAYAQLRHADDQRPADGRRHSSLPESGTHPFFSGAVRKHGDEKGYLLITEEEKKASKLSSRGEPAASVTGWRCWRAPETDELHPGWQQVELPGCNLVPVLDLDDVFNRHIHRELVRLALALYGVGAAAVRLARIPAVADTKLGVDDYRQRPDAEPDALPRLLGGAT